MQRQRMGELLKRLVPLSGHDVDEILNEQRASNLRFGETAISMGLCRPEDVWRAWAGQHSDHVEHVDLDEVGVDAQATTLIDRSVAVRFGVVALRVTGGTLVVATSDMCFEKASTGLPPDGAVEVEVCDRFGRADSGGVGDVLSSVRGWFIELDAIFCLRRLRLSATISF